MFGMETLWQVGALVFAALIATVLRFWDFPNDSLKDVTLVAGLSTFIGAMIGGFFAVWAGGLDPTVWEEFVLVMIAALGGMGGVRALFEVVQPEMQKMELKRQAKLK
jgi:hypothetical protein